MHRQPKILIVDDESFNIAVLEQELDDLHYDTISAVNGQQALEQVAAELPDVVLLDIMMPVMDGFEVLDRLKSSPQTRDIPVIVISASSDISSVVKGITQGAEDYLPKPFDPVLLQARISAALAKKRLRDREIEYLQQVEQLTQAAAAVETATFAPEHLAGVAARSDALGQLARVFQRMAREVYAREQRLKQQLEQLRLDSEERQQAAAETLAVYVPMDRRHALAHGATLPEQTHGAALVADVSGFTALAEAIAQEVGMPRGAEELTRQLNRVYGALIDAVHCYGGSVVTFSGDAITCWFDADDGLRAAACALAMQAAMRQFSSITIASGRSLALAIKVAVAVGPVRRWLVGDPCIQHLEVLAGHTLDVLACGEHLAQPGDVLVHAAVVATTDAQIIAVDWRADARTGARFAVVGGMTAPVPAHPWPELPAAAMTEAQVRPWILAPVYEQVRNGNSAFLSELRPTAALFLSFQGIDYDNDPTAGAQLDAFTRWVQTVLARHNGALLQLTMGDKGSYLYAVFGAPLAHEDDPSRAVAAALELQAPPATLSYITRIQIGLTYGQMRAGAYGSATHRIYGVIGDKANVATRLMEAASTGVLCDESIRYAAQDSMTFEPLPPIRVKGKAQPVVVYRPYAKTTQDTISRRIDQLALPHQLTLKVASVIGAVFAVDLLRAIYPGDADKPHVEEHLRKLEQIGMLIRHPDASHTAPFYAFKDARTHETCYHRLLFAQRRQLHRAVAEWYEQTCGDDLAPHAALLAHHWSKAEDTLKTMQYLEKAGEWAQQHGDYQAALTYFNTSLMLNTQAAVLSDDFYQTTTPEQVSS